MRLQWIEAQEYRFALIVKLKSEGKSQQAIASLIGCGQSWVSQVLKRYKACGGQTVKVKGKAKGNPSRLSSAQLMLLQEILLQGALFHGFDTDYWSRERIKALIEATFGINYHVAHISKLMQKIGFSLQKPKTRSYRKNQQTVDSWKQEKLPALKKS